MDALGNIYLGEKKTSRHYSNTYSCARRVEKAICIFYITITLIARISLKLIDNLVGCPVFSAKQSDDSLCGPRKDIKILQKFLDIDGDIDRQINCLDTKSTNNPDFSMYLLLHVLAEVCTFSALVSIGICQCGLA